MFSLSWYADRLWTTDILFLPCSLGAAPGGLAFDGRWKNTSVLSDFTQADENNSYNLSASD